MKISGQIRGGNIDLKGADFVFWFQSYSNKLNKYVNYALTGKSLNDKLLDGCIHDFELDINFHEPEDWTCLGSCTEKNGLYGDLDIVELDSSIIHSMGFILIPLRIVPLWPHDCEPISSMELSFGSQWPIDTKELPSGTIGLYSLTIEYDTPFEVIGTIQ